MAWRVSGRSPFVTKRNRRRPRARGGHDGCVRGPHTLEARRGRRRAPRVVPARRARADGRRRRELRQRARVRGRVRGAVPRSGRRRPEDEPARTADQQRRHHGGAVRPVCRRPRAAGVSSSSDVFSCVSSCGCLFRTYCCALSFFIRITTRHVRWAAGCPTGARRYGRRRWRPTTSAPSSSRACSRRACAAPRAARPAPRAS